MGGMMTFLQALACLQRGEIVGTPYADEHGHWRFTMERYAANARIRLDAVALCDGARIEKIFVLGDSNERI